MALTAGTRLGHYTVSDLIGEGGMGLEAGLTSCAQSALNVSSSVSQRRSVFSLTLAFFAARSSGLTEGGNGSDAFLEIG
jgi:hypothetical protein